MADKIVIPGKPRTSHNVELVGVDYRVFPPKALVAMDLQRQLTAAGDEPEKLVEALESLLALLFGRKVAPTVLDRLKDPEDDLELDDVMELIKHLLSRASGDDTPTS